MESFGMIRWLSNNSILGDVSEEEDFPTPPPGEGQQDDKRAVAGIVDYENLKSTKHSIDDLPQNFEFCVIEQEGFRGALN
jgi:hypothetical protein